MRKNIRNSYLNARGITLEKYVAIGEGLQKEGMNITNAGQIIFKDYVDEIEMQFNPYIHTTVLYNSLLYASDGLVSGKETN